MVNIPNAQWNKYGSSHGVIITRWGNDKAYVVIKAVRDNGELFCDINAHCSVGGFTSPVSRKSAYRCKTIVEAESYFSKRAIDILSMYGWPEADQLIIRDAIDQSKQMELF